MLDFLRQDLRQAVRHLLRRPVFLLVPVLSLAIGIGATTAIFSAVKEFLLADPPGIPNAPRMVEVGRGSEGRGFDSFSYPDFLDLREEARPMEALAGYEIQILTVSRGGAGDRVMGMLVSANYFQVLGVLPGMGRMFLPEEDQGTDEHPVAVLSHGYWQDRMGGDPEVVGSTVYVSRKPYTVVGVTPRGFHGHTVLFAPDIYVPLVQHPSLNEGQDMFASRNSSWFQVLGLLEEGATVEEADAAVSTVFSRLQEEYPETNARRTASVRPYGALPAPARGPVGLFLGVLLALVTLILLVTCANVAGMLLARGSNREKEIAIRLSMGSGPGRLLRYLLTESMVIFLLGGAAGILLARWGLDLVAAWEVPAPFPIRLDLSPDPQVVLFGVGLTLLTGLVFGLLPARKALSVDLLRSLKGEGGHPGSAGGRLRRTFVAAEIGASLVLLMAAGLFLRALEAAGEIETGFQADDAYISLLTLAQEGYDEEEGEVFHQDLLRYFQDQPWVQEVALAQDLPLDLGAHGTTVVPEGWEEGSARDEMQTDFNSVSPAYFQTLRIPLLEGRGFTPADREGSEPVAVVSRTFAQRAWPAQSPLGRRVKWSFEDDLWLRVVGVVEDTQNQLLTDTPEPFLYRPLAQAYESDGYLVVRSEAGSAAVAQGIRQGLRSLDPRISLPPVIALDRYTEVSILPQRIATGLSSGLGFIALLLSGMGIYGVMAFVVARKRREMGIRAAVGADPLTLLRSVVTGAFRMILPGLILGGLLAVAVGFLLRSLLLGVSPTDPLALGGTVTLVLALVLVGTLVPARRAARIDPAEALRYE